MTVATTHVLLDEGLTVVAVAFETRRGLTLLADGDEIDMDCPSQSGVR